MGAVFVGQLGKLRDGCQPSHSFRDAKRAGYQPAQDAILPHSSLGPKHDLDRVA